MKKFYIILTLLIVFVSCNKDYKTVGLNLIDNNAFSTNLKEIPVNVKMRSIPPYVSNTLSTFQIGEYNDNLYGSSKVSFLGQINFEDPNLVFGDYKQSDEDNPDDNISRIPELETIKNVFLDIPFFTNVDDDDNDGVINIYDVDSTDPYSDSDGDGVCDVDLKELLAFHRAHGKIATVTAVIPSARFGGMHIDGGKVLNFKEKPQSGEGWINGGFFIFEPSIFDYLEDDTTVLEQAPLEKLVNDGELMAYKHHGYWQCMDTIRDRESLQEIWDSGDAPWAGKE